MKKYNYHYIINNTEVDRDTFEEELANCFTVCDTHHTNPLLNIGYVDEKKLNSIYRQLRNQRLNAYLYCTDFGGRTFKIKREEIK